MTGDELLPKMQNDHDKRLKNGVNFVKNVF